MDSHTTIQGIVEQASHWPGIGGLLRARYERRFRAHDSTMRNLYRGVYSSFAEAQASIPQSLLQGYDNAASASFYRERTRRVFLNDYPAMWWLSRLFEEGQTSVFDLGGHIGIAYYAYQRYFRYPDTVRWTVMDVPAVMEAGAAWAEKNDSLRHLSFTSRPEDAGDANVFFAAGSLQYLDYTLAQLLAQLDRRPAHLLLNSVPIHMTVSYFTVQNTGVSCCPYRVIAEREFVDGLRELGYVVRDRWENTDRRCDIPFYPAHSLDRYFGLYLSRES
ncbi:TIGR04325 family methyltransferase [Dyella sp. ASV21]|uniref:TIGR04325 family methyltransferase n=1 Tax=Dyella sp. ASV21 TaxID=2795114 RepID=UPI0018EBCF98|nr:TIGR04325 family methyltransferase [Dyella sp. ASV21]